jgi:GNAT superfamily N-acetyltransferase
MALNQIVIADGSDYRRMWQIKSAVFAREPRFVYFFPDETSRHRQVERLMDLVLRARQPVSRVYTTAPEIRGSAWWFTPQVSPVIDLRQNIRFGFWKSPFLFGAKTFAKMLICNAHVNRLYRREITTPHWVLEALSVDPDWRGKGLGRSLLQPVFDRADRDGLPCFVVTHNLRNISFYRHLGFDLVHERPVPMTGLVCYGLRRKPAKE